MKAFKKAMAATVLVAVFPLTAKAIVVISNDPTQNMSCNNGICAPTQAGAVLNVTELTNMLEAGDVRIYTSFAKKHPKDAYVIDVEAPISWSNSSKLTLTTRVYANINAAITIGGTGTLTLDGYSSRTPVNAPITVVGAGTVSFVNGFSLTPTASITFWDLNGQLLVQNSPYTLVGNVSTLSADIAAAQGKGAYALANDYDAQNDIFHKAPIPDFAGELAGLGHTISNLTIKKGRNDCEGFISKNDGYVHDIRLQAVKIASKNQKFVGAVAGCNYGSIQDVAVDGTVIGSENASVGGIAGANLGNGAISLARATIDVSGGQAGGIAGENDYGVYYAYSTGSVSGQSNTGGLVGTNKGTVQDSYATTAVSGGNGSVGGLAGFNSTSILDCYSTGAVTGTGYVGGFVGYDPNESISNGYWDLDTSGISDPHQGAGFPKGDWSPVGLTTSQFQARLPAGFDKGTWGLDANINNGFPYLRYLPPQ